MNVTNEDIAKTAARLQKIAAGGVWGTFKKGLSRGAGLGLAALGLGAGAMLAGKGIDVASRKMTSKGRFNAMLQLNPGLKKFNQQHLKRRWNTLNRFSPAMAKDPIVAGTFLKRTMELGGDIDVQTVAQIAKARKDIATGTGGAAKALPEMMAPGISGGMKMKGFDD